MAYQVPSRFGFRVVERWQFSFAQLTKSLAEESAED
jgi:mannosyltransferase